MSERAALLLLDQTMQRHGITRDDVDPIISMKLAVLLDDTSEPEAELGFLEDCGPGCICRRDE